MTDTPHSPSPPSAPDPAVLENRWLHAIMVFFQSFQIWPALLHWLVLLVTFGIIYLVWGIASPATALAGTLIFAVAALLDVALLWLLPRQKISYGPPAAQMLVILFPRFAVTALAILLSAWQPMVGLGVMFALQLLGTVAYGWGMWAEPRNLGLTRITLSTPHLAADSPPITLLHLSDIHLERLTRREARILELVEETKPDLIALTGDYLNLSYNNDPEAVALVREFLPKLKAPLGVYATLGSPPVDLHDVASHHFDDTHIQLLRHTVVAVDAGHNRQLTLMGMDCSHDVPYDGHRFEQLAAQKNGHGPAIFLYHSPELMPLVQKHAVDLYLCGHTHGGQVRVPGYGAIITSAITGKRYEMGRYDENGTTLYVSRGIGLEGLSAPRIRLFCPPEAILITLIGK